MFIRVNPWPKYDREKKTSNRAAETPLPNSRKVYVAGELHPDLRVPFREISLAPTKTMSGEIEVNEPVRVYDTSGPWGDADQQVDVNEGLPALRAKWIRDRGDVEEIVGPRGHADRRRLSLSDKHAASSQRPETEIDNLRILHSQSSPARKPLRAKPGNAVTQLYYAREGIITPEMEFIAIRENAGRAARSPDRLEPICKSAT